MRLVVDANIVISLLINPSNISISTFFDENLELFVPEFIFVEIENNIDEIKRKTKFSNEEVSELILILKRRLTTIPEKDFVSFRKDAQAVSPDKKDISYFALALYLKCPIWSHDKPIQKQSSVKILSTAEIIKMLKK